MGSIRQEKISRLLQKELATMFLQSFGQLFLGAMVTVTKVRVSPDLGTSKIYLSIFAVEDKSAVIEKVNTGSHEIRYQLAARLKNNLRRIPLLTFYLDDSLDYQENIDELLT